MSRYRRYDGGDPLAAPVDLAEALDHIARWTTGHTEAIVADSATAIAAAWANRFEPPMTKVSKVYLGLRRESLSRRGRNPSRSRYVSRLR